MNYKMGNTASKLVEAISEINSSLLSQNQHTADVFVLNHKAWNIYEEELRDHPILKKYNFAKASGWKDKLSPCDVRGYLLTGLLSYEADNNKNGDMPELEIKLTNEDNVYSVDRTVEW